MSSRDIDEFCAAVQREMRDRYARAAVAEELSAHMEDHAAALAEQGRTAREAEAEAVRAMGDPTDLGRSLNRVHRPWGYYLCLAVRPVALLAVFLCLCVLAECALNSRRGPTPDPLFPRLFTARAVKAELAGLPYDRLETGEVTGGGDWGNYTVEPYGRAALSETPYLDTPYLLQFSLRTTHWEPWLEDLSLHNMTLLCDVPGSDARLSNLGRDARLGRLDGIHTIYIALPDADIGHCTVSLGAGERVLRFYIDLGGDAA